jgi:hypothetical protein
MTMSIWDPPPPPAPEPHDAGDVVSADQLAAEQSLQQRLAEIGRLEAALAGKHAEIDGPRKRLGELLGNG